MLPKSFKLNRSKCKVSDTLHFTAETITPLIVKAMAERRAKESAKMARREAESADMPRKNGLAAEMNAINIQLKTDRQLREGLQLHIENNRGKMEYETKNRTFTGLPIAQTYSQAVVLTSEGIKAFEIHHQITYSGGGSQTPSFSAKDIGFAKIGELLPPKDFPSVEALSQKIKTLLDILS